MASEGPHPLLCPVGQLLLLGVQVFRVQRRMGEEAGAKTTAQPVKPEFGERRHKWMNEYGSEAGVRQPAVRTQASFLCRGFPISKTARWHLPPWGLEGGSELISYMLSTGSWTKLLEIILRNLIVH